jgi:hypothetical protein
VTANWGHILRARVSHDVTSHGASVMDATQIVVTVSGAVLIAAVLLFFFGPKRRQVGRTLPKAGSRKPKADL